MPNDNLFPDLKPFIQLLQQLNQLMNHEWLKPYRQDQGSAGSMPGGTANPGSRPVQNPSSPPSQPSQPVQNPSSPPAELSRPVSGYSPPPFNLQEFTSMLNLISQIFNNHFIKNSLPPNSSPRAANPPPVPDLNQIVKIVNELGTLFKNFRA